MSVKKLMGGDAGPSQVVGQDLANDPQVGNQDKSVLSQQGQLGAAVSCMSSERGGSSFGVFLWYGYQLGRQGWDQLAQCGPEAIA